MALDNKKIGIITFHASYNCGSMLQAYALQRFLEKNGYCPEIVDFSSEGQRRLYSMYSKKITVKNMVRNAIFWSHRKRIENNYKCYENFKQQYFNLTSYNAAHQSQIVDNYVAVVAGADQIWNITIADYDDAYFLPWVIKSKRIAYAPSFGAKNISEHTDDVEKYKRFLNEFDYLSIRENNGKQWIYDLIGKDVPVVLDPTLIIEPEDYDKITSCSLKLPEKYIFYYSPTYSVKHNLLVRKISKKYGLPVIGFNSKSFYLRGMNFQNIILPDFEDPTAYLQLMKNATMVITTSFHGSIFSTVFNRNFWVIKNGGMYGKDDRVLTLLRTMGLEARFISEVFDKNFDYMVNVDYKGVEHMSGLNQARAFSQKYLLSALESCNETNK